jgi:hypothetical protein
VSLLNVVNMSDAERDARREADEAAYRSVEAYCSRGIARSKALTKAAASLGIARQDVIAGYWRYLRRLQAEPAPRRRRRA